MENKGFLKHPQAVLLLLCLIALLSYGQLIVEPGLYGDDPVLLAAHLQGGADGCLQVLGPDSYLEPGTNPLLQQAQCISNPGMILPDASPPARPPEWLGAEPDHSQCTG